MKEFISYLISNWYAAAGLALLIVVTVVAWIKACSAGKKRSAERERIIAELEEEKALRKQFKVIDENTRVLVLNPYGQTYVDLVESVL